MFCPLKEIELNVDKCPARCIYRRSDGSCAHNDLAYDENLTPEDIAQILMVPVDEVLERAERSKRKVRVALVVDHYVGFALPPGTVNKVEQDEAPILRLFNIPRSLLNRVLNRERYERWKEIAKVEVEFDEIEELFLSALKP